MSAGASAAAAGAAAARRRAEQQEEERMTGYSDADLGEAGTGGTGGAGGWEFKILRSATGAFRKPEVLRRALEEEAKAGWVLLEKFDSQRIRLKRPAAARSGDSALGFDPYRTDFGVAETRLGLLIAGCALGLVALVIWIIFIATRP
ncbi:MAG: hypothetical protein KF745_13560 [Phycisphaeraceae bacterium]|nr:hypothetical protein [Phycisphaeraceae bacterium]